MSFCGVWILGSHGYARAVGVLCLHSFFVKPMAQAQRLAALACKHTARHQREWCTTLTTDIDEICPRPRLGVTRDALAEEIDFVENYYLECYIIH